MSKAQKVNKSPPKRPTQIVAVRYREGAKDDFALVAEFLNFRNTADMIRAWSLSRLAEEMSSQRFLSWKRERAKRLEEEEKKRTQDVIA